VVRTPQFNASMAPNGMMEVWTGLLLRCSDEAQLAAILGHEMGTTCGTTRSTATGTARDKSSSARSSASARGRGRRLCRSLANLALIASIFAYSRDQEREADEIGLELMSKAATRRSPRPRCGTTDAEPRPARRSARKA